MRKCILLIAMAVMFTAPFVPSTTYADHYKQPTIEHHSPTQLQQADAGFLESPSPGGGVWGGPGWYCIYYNDPNYPFGYAIAGPFATSPDCSAY